jgi:enoyl reductase
MTLRVGLRIASQPFEEMNMSKAIVFANYGGPDVLQLVEVPSVAPKSGEVQVRVRAAGVQPFDALFRSGAAQRWAPANFPQRLGNEWSGTIESIGAGVTTFSVGDQVLGWAMLTAYGEHVVVSVDQLVRKPQQMLWSEAGALPASGQTASTGLEELNVGDGQTVLIHAAAGGVGSFAVQIARAKGATVIGTASERNQDYLKSLGAIPVVYGDNLVQKIRSVAPSGVDAALVAVDSAEAMEASIELVADKGRIGTVAFSPLARQLGIRQLSTERSVTRLNELVTMYASGQLRVNIQREFPLAEATEAHRLIEGGHVRGKVVLMVDHD